METHHLNNWLLDHPSLKRKLSDSDKAILDRIDPLEFELYYLTDRDVINIVRDRRPHATHWESRYPNLKNLTPEERAILDRICPRDFHTEPTEQGLRQCVQAELGRKAEREKTRRLLSDARYCGEHKEEIEKELRQRDKMSDADWCSIILGSSIISTGIALHNPLCYTIGITGLAAYWVYSILRLRRMNRHTVLLKPVALQNTKIPASVYIIIVCYFIGLIGIGILLSALITWLTGSAQTAGTVLNVGLASVLAPVALSLIIAIATPSKR